MHRSTKNQGHKHTARNQNRSQNEQIQNQQISNRVDNFDRFFNDFADDEDFFNDFGLMRRMNDFGNMRSLMNYDSVASNNADGYNLPGTCISKSYVSTVKYDGHGRPHKEEYQSQSIKQTDELGKKIQETQRAYQNTSTGVQKAAQERILNDKGHKFVKERNMNSGDSMEQHIYKGMGEEELPQFNNEYSNYRQRSNFERNYQMLESNRPNRNANRNNLMLGQEQINPNFNNISSNNINNDFSNLNNINTDNNSRERRRNRNFWTLQK